MGILVHVHVIAATAANYIIGACNHFFFLNARNCGYAQVEDLVCVVVCRKELWLCANGRFSTCSGMPQGIVCEWEDLGWAAYQSHI